jgi:hypothetical protein
VCSENLNPDVVVVNSTKYRGYTDASVSLNRARNRRVFVHDPCVLMTSVNRRGVPTPIAS